MTHRLKTTLLCGLLCAAGAAAAVPEGPYVTLWEDNFNGHELDRTVWNVEENGSGCGNNELEYYIDSPANLEVRDGALVIKARRTPHGDSHHFTSARLNTRGKKAFTYGIIEASIKLPATADGLWPAFWMMGDIIHEIGWPACGEIDILEMGHADGIAAGSQDRLFNGAIHYGLRSSEHRQIVGPSTNAYSLQDGRFHTFRAVWTPEKIEMYVDSIAEPYLSVDITATTDATSPGYYFHQPHFILLNLAVGGDFTGIHDPAAISALPEDGSEAEMLVDYVRVLTPAVTYNK